MKKKKQEAEKEAPRVESVGRGVVSIEALRDYAGRTLTIQKGQIRLVPFEVAHRIIAEHGDNPPIALVKAVSSPFNKAITEEETK